MDHQGTATTDDDTVADFSSVGDDERRPATLALEAGSRGPAADVLTIALGGLAAVLALLQV